MSHPIKPRAPRDNGAPDYKPYLHPSMLRNYGQWKSHRDIRPGVFVHEAESGDQLYTVRAGSPRLMSSGLLRRICEVADKSCQGRLRFTSRNNIEFQVETEAEVQPLIEEIEKTLGFPVGGTGRSVHNIIHTQGWLHCNLPNTDASGVVKSIMDMLYEEFTHENFPQRVKISTSCCTINCGGQTDIAINMQHHHPPVIDHEMIGRCELPKVIAICPVMAIRPDRKDGQDTVEVVEEKCMYCGACHAQCPALEIRDADTDTLSLWVGGKSSHTRGGPAFMKLAAIGLPNNPPRWPEVGEALKRLLYAYKDGAREYERVGEWIDRIGWKNFFDVTGFEFTKYHIDSYRWARTTFNTSAHVRF